MSDYAGWTNLDDDELRRLGELIDSRVRLLGEPYGRAVEACSPSRMSEENRRWMLGYPR